MHKTWSITRSIFRSISVAIRGRGLPRGVPDRDARDEAEDGPAAAHPLSHCTTRNMTT